MAFVKRKQAFIDIKDLKPGDIIGFYRAGGSYFHGGIYDGKGNVIHRGAEPGSGSGAAIDTNSSFAMFGKESNKAEIRKDDLRLVAGSSPVYRINMFDKVYTPCPESEIVRWAEEQIGKKGYNVFFKNCQHFCTKARYDISFNMQVQEHIILKSEQPYEMNRTLVNIVNLPKLPHQSVDYTTTEENVSSLEGYVGNISRHMDLYKLSGKGLCALASSSVAIPPILTALKNYTHTLFTETGNGFQRATFKFDQLDLLIKQCDKVGVTLQAADHMLCTIATSDTYRFLQKVQIESNTAGIRESDAGYMVGNYVNMSDKVFGYGKIVLDTSTANLYFIREFALNSNFYCRDILMFTEIDGTSELSEVFQGLSIFDCANSTANSSTQWRAECSNVAENRGHIEFQEYFDDEDMRNRNDMLYKYGMAGGLVSTVTIFDTVIFFCWSWMLYLIKCLFLFFLIICVSAILFVSISYLKATVLNLKGKHLFRLLLNILSVVLIIIMIFVI